MAKAGAAAGKGLRKKEAIRYGRMLASPLAFLRGSAAIMASDLSHTPVLGNKVQACGDCHLMNFGLFATPERNIIFDINDFDETLSMRSSAEQHWRERMRDQGMPI
ncbi:MAG TPA: DUF2252 family protein [Candidatus Acidoferrales bacterium]|nr:DUF2252 family protein [Candidatus Acidoferrales bacterium]